jgi:hypothetical protein
MGIFTPFDSITSTAAPLVFGGAFIWKLSPICHRRHF